MSEEMIKFVICMKSGEKFIIKAKSMKCLFEELFKKIPAQQTENMFFVSAAGVVNVNEIAFVVPETAYIRNITS